MRRLWHFLFPLERPYDRVQWPTREGRPSLYDDGPSIRSLLARL